MDCRQSEFRLVCMKEGVVQCAGCAAAVACSCDTVQMCREDTGTS